MGVAPLGMGHRDPRNARPYRRTLIALRERAAFHSPTSKARSREALVDTSALIDGRLPDVVLSGFLDLDLIVPEFVLVPFPFTDQTAAK